MRMGQYVWLDEPYGEIGPLRIAERYYSILRKDNKGGTFFRRFRNKVLHPRQVLQRLGGCRIQLPQGDRNTIWK